MRRLAMGPKSEDRLVSVSTLVAGATFVLSVGLFVWAMVSLG
jgi:hypothetical protein